MNRIKIYVYLSSLITFINVRGQNIYTSEYWQEGMAQENINNRRVKGKKSLVLQHISKKLKKKSIQIKMQVAKRGKCSLGEVGV